MAADHAHANHEHGSIFYVKIWALLLALLLVSIVGPMLGNKVVTLVTGFGIAVVKATLVGAHFMHLKIEKKYITYLLLTMLLAVGLFFISVAPDVMKTEGTHWTNQAAHNLIEHYKTHNAAEEGHHAGAGAEGQEAHHQ